MRLPYTIRRLMYSIITLLGVSIIVFVGMRFIPGNPVLLMLGPYATAEQVSRANIELGLNQPIYFQYIIWLRGLLTLNLGTSFISNQPVGLIISESLARSLQLVALGMTISVGAGMLTGLISGTFPNKKILDNFLNSFAAIWSSVPSFWIALELIAIFAVLLHWLPAAGVGGIKSMILPSLVYTLFSLPEVHRTIRTNMIEELEKPYCLTARAKGASTFRIVTRHAIRNALVPLVTVVGVQVGFLLSAAIVVELVFGWSGIGLLIVNSVLGHDYLVAQDSIVLLALIVVAANTIADLIVLRLNRRIRL